MNTPDSPNAVFRPRARLLSLLGEQLISDQAVGLIELVKNAYDADATRVEIELLGLNTPETSQIILRDNGFGMTHEDIEQKWLSPAVNHKERQKKARQRTPLGRLPIGEKGVGRFAVQQLGHRFQMISRFAHSPEMVVQINWDDFDREDTYLDDVMVVLDERKPLIFTEGATGTILIIEQARTPWTEGMVARVQRALRRLQSPHQGQHKVDFQITFRCPDFPAYQDISNSDILDRAHYIFEGLVTEEGLLDYEYSCHHPAVQERSAAVENYNLFPAAKHEMFSPDSNSSGPFYLNFYVWDRTQEYLNQSGVSRADLDAMAGVSIFRDRLRVLPYGEPGNDWLDLDKERINNPSERIGNQQIIGFVEVFQEKTPGLRDKTNREGLIDNAAFRDLRALVRATVNIFTSQWLQDRQKMEKRSKTGSHEPPRDSLQKARTLTEKVTETARDDIVVKIEEPSLLPPVPPASQVTSTPIRAEQPAPAPENTAQDDIIVKTEESSLLPPMQPVSQITSTSARVEQFAPVPENRVLSAEPQVTQPESPPPQLTQRQAMHQILDYLKDAATYQEKSETEAEQRAQVLMHLAATGMAAERVAHEFGRQVSAALAALRILRDPGKGDNAVAEAISTLDACMGTLRNEFRVLAPYEASWRMQRTVPVSAYESTRLAFKLNDYLITSVGITAEIEGEDFDIVARPASLVQIMDNLVHNACVWLEGWRGLRQINVTLDNAAHTIIIADTGPGVPSHMRESIFRPFVSLRNGGRGLGLYITQEILRAMQGSIQLDQQRESGQGARFILQFPAPNKDRSTSGNDQQSK
jgi:C4-dicarboxylate-specific signal transduction histidine kinase